LDCVRQTDFILCRPSSLMLIHPIQAHQWRRHRPVIRFRNN
jgi:hypothetical protein